MSIAGRKVVNIAPADRYEPMTGAAGIRGAAETMMVRCAGVELVVMAMPFRLPDEEWKLPVLRVASQWPASNTLSNVTLTGTKLLVKVGANNGAVEYTPIAHLAVTQIQ